MVNIARLTKWEELDTILPMMLEFHRGNKYYRLYPTSGFLSWLTLNFLNSNLAVWGIYRDGNVVGYSICQISWKWMVKECSIVDAVFGENQEELSKLLEKEIVDWANKNECTRLEAITGRVEAMERKYNAECVAGIIIRKLEPEV